MTWKEPLLREQLIRWQWRRATRWVTQDFRAFVGAVARAHAATVALRDALRRVDEKHGNALPAMEDEG